WQIANPAANPLRLLAHTRGYPRAVAARNVRSADYLERRFGAAGRLVAGGIGVVGDTLFRSGVGIFRPPGFRRARAHPRGPPPHLRELLARAPDAVVLCFTELQDPPGPCLHAERELAAQPEFKTHYARAAEFGRAEVPSDYHVVFTRAEATAP